MDISEHCWDVYRVLKSKALDTENSDHLRKVAISEKYSCNCAIEIIHGRSVKNCQTHDCNEYHYIIGIQLKGLFMTCSAAHLGFSYIKG